MNKVFSLILLLLVFCFTQPCLAQYYGSSRQAYSYARGSSVEKIERLPGPRYYGPHPGCMMCLGNHLIGTHGQSYNFLNKISYTQWSTLHDNCHNARTVAQKRKPVFIQNTQPIFAPTPQDVVEKMLQLGEVDKETLVYDLGCGDGRIVITAATRYGCGAIGFEIDPKLVKLAKENVKLNNLSHRVRIVEQDILKLDLSKVDVITLYLSSELNYKLIPQLKKMKKGGRIISHYHPIPTLRIDRAIEVKSKDGMIHPLYLMITPIEELNTGSFL